MASAMSSALISPVARQKAFSLARLCRARPLQRQLVIRSCLKTSASTTVQRKRLRANGLNFVVDDQGNEAATPVILLHGFPNRANLWERQIPSLLDEGFRVIAPDLRGAFNGESDAPRDVKDYHLTDVLVKDVEGILDALGIQKAHIVGHDWGSSLAWAFAALYPDRTLQLVGMSVGNPVGYMQGPHASEQKRKSWYMLLFVLHGPRSLMSLNVCCSYRPCMTGTRGWSGLEHYQEPLGVWYMLLFGLRGIAEKLLASGKLFSEGAGPPEAAAVEKPMLERLGINQNIDKPDNWTSGLNWYRANAGWKSFLTGSLIKLPNVKCDTLQLWFTGDDPVCTEGQAKSSGQFVDSPASFRYERIHSASHFAPWTDPEPVAASLKSFLRK